MAKSSMPAKSALSGYTWTPARTKQIVGRWVKIGFEDCPAQTVFVAGKDYYGDPVAYSLEGRSRGSILDSPEQVIKIGPKMKAPTL